MQPKTNALPLRYPAMKDFNIGDFDDNMYLSYGRDHVGGGSSLSELAQGPTPINHTNNQQYRHIIHRESSFIVQVYIP